MELIENENSSGQAGALKSRTLVNITYSNLDYSMRGNTDLGGTLGGPASVSEREDLGRDPEKGPTPSITWVINNKMLEIGIDYLALTIYGGYELAIELYNGHLAEYFGELEYKGESRFYEGQYTADFGFYFQNSPRMKKNRNHCRFILPGKACERIPLDIFRELIGDIEKRGIDWRCTRLDIRIDNCPFTPLQIAGDIEQGKARTYADLATLKKYDQPFEKDEKGAIGTHGMYLGARESPRYLRIYDMHGFTRLELECKEEFADLFFKEFMKRKGDISDLAMGYCMDYLELDTDYWREFTRGYDRAYAKAKQLKDPTIQGFKTFLKDQCSIIFSIIYDIEGLEFFEMLIRNGRRARKTNARYTAICHSYGID